MILCIMISYSGKQFELLTIQKMYFHLKVFDIKKMIAG